MNASDTEQYDLVIVGAGLVGSSLALALRQSGYKIALVDQQPLFLSAPNGHDYRNLVLSLSSQRIFAALGIWAKIHAHTQTIDTIHVSEQGRYPHVLMQAKDCQLDVLAYSIPAPVLAQQLHQQLDQFDNLTVYTGAKPVSLQQHTSHAAIHIEHHGVQRCLTSKLLVLATGTDCALREQLGFVTERKDYHQQAVVGNITTERFLPHTAFERFSPHGPFALLPAQDHYGMVCVVHQAMANDILTMSDEAFIEYLQQRLGRRLGRIFTVGKRKAYPLQFLSVQQPYQQRVLLMGNAAHTIHPNGAQGFNLGLRDVAQLAEMITDPVTRHQDLGDEELLARYVEQRQQDQQQVLRFSDQLGTLFYNNEGLKRGTRTALMMGSEFIKPMKQSFMLRALGIHGQQADMVKGL